MTNAEVLARAEKQYKKAKYSYIYNYNRPNVSEQHRSDVLRTLEYTEAVYNIVKGFVEGNENESEVL